MSIFLITAPSGAGKTTIMNNVVDTFKYSGFPRTVISECISTTTRPMRENEKNGETYYFISREEFEEYKKIYKNNLSYDAIEKAKIFYYLVNAGFASDIKNPVFGTKAQSRNRLRPEEIEGSINNAYKRLQKVTIENKSFDDMFRIYDKEDTFFFLDSPYRNTKQYAVGKFTDEQYQQLAECCKNAKGKWMYTINNDDYIKELFKDFNIMDMKCFIVFARQTTVE